MNKNARSHTTLLSSVALAVVLGGALTGCAGGARIGELDDSVKRFKTDLQDLRAIQAEHTASLDELKAQIGALNSRIDELQYSAKGKTEQLEEQLRVMSSRVPPPPGVPEELLNRDDESISKNTGAAAELFRASLLALRNGEFQNASTGFARFVQENPATAYTDNALFWLGVCAERQNQLNQAVLNYSDVFKRFPAEDFVAPALYRLGEVFNKMGSKQEAVLALQKLVDEHGNTPYGARGRELLQTLQPKKKKR